MQRAALRLMPFGLFSREPEEDDPVSALKPLKIDIVSDVVCPWCYIGKKRIEDALALVPDVPLEVNWRPFFLNPWVPREGISREDYLTTKFGSVEAYKRVLPGAWSPRPVKRGSPTGLIWSSASPTPSIAIA